MMRASILFALAAALPGAMSNAAGPSSAVKPAKVAPAKAPPLALAPGVRRVALSAEGKAIAQKIMGTPDARVAQIRTEMTALTEEQKKLIVGPKIDLDRLEMVLLRREALQTEIRARSNERMMELLRALSEPDQVALLQSLANPAQLQNSSPPPPPASGR